jgi:hypothetical protein
VIEPPAADSPKTDVASLIFVCGVGRSGTSLVQSMLAAHPDVAFLPETGFLRRYAFGRVLEKQYRRDGIESVVARIDEDLRIRNLGIASEDIVEPFISGTQRFTDIACYRRILALFALRCGKSTIGDKDPRLIEFLPFVKRCFPHARILHVVRDPRDVLVSKQKAAWSKGRSWWQHVFANRVQFEIGHRSGRENFGERYQVVFYEELLERPDETLARVCEHLDLAFAPSMLDFSAAARQLVRPDELEWKRETTGHLKRHNSGKWRDSLTAFQTAIVERICAWTMKFGHYERSERYRELPFRQRFLVLAIGVAAPCLAKLYGGYRRSTMLRSS